MPWAFLTVYLWAAFWFSWGVASHPSIKSWDRPRYWAAVLVCGAAWPWWLAYASWRIKDKESGNDLG